jgi:hypothetical protein
MTESTADCRWGHPYLRPIAIHDSEQETAAVGLLRAREQEENALWSIRERFLDVATYLLDEPGAARVMRMRFPDAIENPESSLVETQTRVPRNALVSAFVRSLDGSITPRGVKKNLRAIDGE